MSRTPIKCCFCNKEGQTVLESWDNRGTLLLCIFPHRRISPKIYACRKCLRLKWKLKDKEFSDEVKRITQQKLRP